jgi:hypothetical protein
VATRLSALDGLRVVDTQGNPLGHVWDVRTQAREGASEGESRQIAAVLVGPAALLERLGFKRPGGSRLSWKKVVGVTSDHLVVQ